MDYNKVILLGTVDSEPGVSRRDHGTHTEFLLKTDIRLGDSSREDVHKVITNSSVADFCSKLHKGDHILVEGWLRYQPNPEVVANAVKKDDGSPLPPKKEKLLYRGGERSENW